jgi:hypothetical protein
VHRLPGLFTITRRFSSQRSQGIKHAPAMNKSDRPKSACGAADAASPHEASEKDVVGIERPASRKVGLNSEDTSSRFQTFTEPNDPGVAIGRHLFQRHAKSFLQTFAEMAAVFLVKMRVNISRQEADESTVDDRVGPGIDEAVRVRASALPNRKSRCPGQSAHVIGLFRERCDFGVLQPASAWGVWCSREKNILVNFREALTHGRVG